MPQYKIKIDIEAQSPKECQRIGNLLQNAVNKLDQEDMVRLLEKVKKRPGIVKNALMFI